MGKSRQPLAWVCVEAQYIGSNAFKVCYTARMRILVIGDSHCDTTFIKNMFTKAEAFDCDALFVVGDFGFWPKFASGRKFLEEISRMATRAKKPLYWIDGNHEDFDSLEDVYGGLSLRSKPIEIRKGIFYMPRGYSWVWDDVKFAGFGGGTSIDKDYRTEGKDWFPQELLTEADVEKSQTIGEVDILFTHDIHDMSFAQQAIFLRGGDTLKNNTPAQNNRKKLQAIVDNLQPKVIIHGHYHIAYSARIDGANIYGLDCNKYDKIGDSFTVIDTKDFNGKD